MNYLIRNYISNLKKDIHDAKTDLCPLSAALLLIDDITASQFNDGHFRTCGHKKEYFTGSRSFYEFFADYGAIKLLGFSKEAFEYFNEMTGLDIEGLMDDFYNMAIWGENKDKIRKKV